MTEKARFNITPGMTVAFDFESFYDSKARYSLRVMTPYQYVMDPRFDAYLVAFKAENGERWVGNPQQFDWSSLTGAHMIAHNAAFDGLVLKRLQDLGRVAVFDYTLDCTADMVAYFCVPRSLKDAAKRFLGETVSKAVRSNMDGRQWSSLTQDEVTAVVEYGGGDADLCLRLWQAKSKDWPEFERKISRLNREAGWRGVRINRKATIEGLRVMQKVKAEAEAQLPWVQRGIGAESTAELARHAQSLGLPIPSSFNKQDPAMQAWIKTHAEKHPFIQARIDVASVTKHIARLESMLDLADEKDIIRFSAKYYGSHCLDGAHEVLTPDGWVRLDVWDGGEIMQWSPGGGLQMSNAEANSFANEEPTAVCVDAPYVKAVMTLGHTVPVFPRHRSGFKTIPAERLLTRSSGFNTPVSGVWELDCGLPDAITETQMRVIVATQADGCFAKPYGELIFTLRRKNKIERIQELLSAAGIKFRLQYFPSSPTQARVTVPRRGLPLWLTPRCKVFGAWLLRSTYAARRAFVDEFPRWDGWHAERQLESGTRIRLTQYYTTVRENADWTQTMLHITGSASGKVSIKPADPSRNLKAAYTLSQRRVTYAGIEPAKHCRKTAAPSVVYCPTTATGFFLCRYKGRIFVSGNTGRSSGAADDDTKGGAKFNVFNIPKGDAKTGLTFGVDLRGLLIPRPGYRFVINDYSQIEPRITHWFAGNTVFLQRVFKENIYQAAAKVMGWYPDDGLDLKHENPKLYKLAKACTIGLSYGMGAAKFLLTCRKDRVSLDPVPKAQWALDRRTKFLLLNVAHIDYRDPQREHEVCEFLAADKIVMQWRQANQPVVKLWSSFQSILENAAANQLPSYSFVLPSGRKKTYYRPHFKTGNKIIIDPETMEKTNKPEKRLCASLIDGYPAEDLHGGPITENLVQATARDVMFSGAVDCADAGMDFLFNVYDEVAGEVPEAEAKKWETLMPKLLCQGSAAPWTAGLPLAVEGGVRDKYEK